MKAIIYYEYGGPEVLRYEEIAKPAPGDKEVLIRVRAAAVNPYDWHFLRGTPYPLRLMAGSGKPKNPRLGADVAGEVEAVGKNVTLWKAGDAVFGACVGAFAEYVCTRDTKVVRKPENVTFAQAASAYIAGITALQGLRDKGQIRAGQKVLINGAAGGVGTFAVQIARSFGAAVSGVCSTRNVEMVRSIGAEHVIDYAQEDFTANGGQYDLILDCVGNRALTEIKRCLTPEGIYVGAGGTTDNWMIGPMVTAFERMVLSWFGRQKLLMILATARQQDLATLAELMRAGKVTPVIDRCYKLSETAEAIRYLELGHARGKVVLLIDQDGYS
jgi:NADPH:quinone reductase-like Zn-dependent oxidoreductase